MSGIRLIECLGYPTTIYNVKPLELTSSEPAAAATQASLPAPAPLLVFIPGNPGMCEFYVDYLNCLHKKMPTYEILAISYAAFVPDAQVQDIDEVIGLQKQAEHKIEIIKELRGSDPREMVLLGHSVGTYMIQKMLIKLHDDKDPMLNDLKFVGLITPTINEIGLSANGVVLAKALQWFPRLHIHLAKLSYVTRKIPTNMLFNLLSWRFGTESKNIIGAASSFITSRNLMTKTLGLAHEEIDKISGDITMSEEMIKIFKQNDIKSWVFFCHTDYWIHEKTRTKVVEMLSKSLDDCKIEIHDDIKLQHSFIFRSGELFANITKNAILV